MNAALANSDDDGDVALGIIDVDDDEYGTMPDLETILNSSKGEQLEWPPSGYDNNDDLFSEVGDDLNSPWGMG